MRILITGGAGFIGSHLAERLVARGDDVLVLDNFVTGRRDNLDPGPRLHVVEGSIVDEQLVADTFAGFGPDLVVHAAASYKDPAAWLEDARTNVVGTVSVVKASERQRVRRLIYFQTALCYGLHPLEQPITLTHPVRPEGSSYAVSKTAAEHYIGLSSLDFVSFRLANAYGPRNLSGPLPTFFHRLTSGRACYVMDTRRDFIFVDDLVDCVLKAIDGAGSRGHYHISSGRDFAIRELYDAARAALDLPPDGTLEVRPRHPDDVFSILLDPSQTERAFGWRASTGLTSGVARAIAYYRKFGVSQTYTHLKLSDEA
jgi:UDP-glucose 4-epimerase